MATPWVHPLPGEKKSSFSSFTILLCLMRLQETPFKSSVTSVRWSTTAQHPSTLWTAPSTCRTCAKRRCLSNLMVSDNFRCTLLTKQKLCTSYLSISMNRLFRSSWQSWTLPASMASTHRVTRLNCRKVPLQWVFMSGQCCDAKFKLELNPNPDLRTPQIEQQIKNAMLYRMVLHNKNDFSGCQARASPLPIQYMQYIHVLQQYVSIFRISSVPLVYKQSSMSLCCRNARVPSTKANSLTNVHSLLSSHPFPLFVLLGYKWWRPSSFSLSFMLCCASIK